MKESPRVATRGLLADKTFSIDFAEKHVTL
jgi:hypothetical protein